MAPLIAEALTPWAGRKRCVDARAFGPCGVRRRGHYTRGPTAGPRVIRCSSCSASSVPSSALRLHHHRRRDDELADRLQRRQHPTTVRAMRSGRGSIALTEPLLRADPALDARPRRHRHFAGHPDPGLLLRRNRGAADVARLRRVSRRPAALAPTRAGPGVLVRVTPKASRKRHRRHGGDRAGRAGAEGAGDARCRRQGEANERAVELLAAAMAGRREIRAFR